MTTVFTVARSRWCRASLGALLLVLTLSVAAFAACPSAFSVDFSGAKYTDCFRDVLRGSDINAGTDLASTGHAALNFTGSTGSASSTWLTVYDDPATPGPTFGAETLCADVLIRQAGNSKGAGVVALLNEGAGKKGL